MGYLEPGKFEGMTEDERNAVLDECFEHNDHLRANGHVVAEVALQPPETALTLYHKELTSWRGLGTLQEDAQKVGKADSPRAEAGGE